MSGRWCGAWGAWKVSDASRENDRSVREEIVGVEVEVKKTAPEGTVESKGSESLREGTERADAASMETGPAIRPGPFVGRTFILRDADVAGLIAAQAKPALSRSVTKMSGRSKSLHLRGRRRERRKTSARFLLRADSLLARSVRRPLRHWGDGRRVRRRALSEQFLRRGAGLSGVRRRRLLRAGCRCTEGKEQGKGDRAGSRLHGSLLVQVNA